MNDKQKALVKYFEKRVNYHFYEVFKLYDYELEVSKQTKSECRASAYWHDIETGAQASTICWSEEWINETPIKEEVDKVAFHECAEVLLAELQELVQARYIQKRDLTMAVHRVIRKLENGVFEKLKDKNNTQ